MSLASGERTESTMTWDDIFDARISRFTMKNTSEHHFQLPNDELFFVYHRLLPPPIILKRFYLFFIRINQLFNILAT